MKKLISPKMRLLVIIILISLITIFKYTNHNNITYISLGDGYSKGKNSFGINEYGYSDYLKDKMIEDKKLKSYINVYTSETMSIEELKNNILNNQKNVIGKQKIYLKEQLQEADIITLSVGINDLKYKIMLEENMDYKKNNKIINDTEREYDNLIKEIRKYYKKEIYVIGYPNNVTDSYYLSIAIRQFNNYLENHKEVNYISVKELEYEKNRYFLNPKSNYYSRDGYSLIADKIYKKYKNA